GKGSHLLKIVRTNPDNYIRNIQIIPEEHLEAHQQGEIFNPDWIERVESFQALRFMNWMKTNNSRQEFWEQRPKIGDRSWAIDGGIPLEVMLELANRLGVDPWFNIPHLADLNYVREFATLVETKLDRDLNIYLEHSNEVWNWQFEQAKHAGVSGQARWGERGDAYMQWHGMRTAQICDVFKEEVFDSKPQRVKCILGVHPHWHGLEEGALNCPLWVAEGNEACYLHGFDYVGITTYFNGGLNGPRKANDDFADIHTSILKSWLREPDGGMSKAFEQLADGRHLRSIEKYADYQGIEAELRERLEYWQATAENYGMGMVAYEGGQHITANGHVLRDNEAIVDFHIAVSRNPRMRDMYATMLDLWQEYGGGLHVHFVDVAAPTKHGSWGALEHLEQETSPKWEALMEFNRELSQQ
ncbi:MAG: cellulose-binding protein, partial [Cyanobacteria bacterium J06641_5]